MNDHERAYTYHKAKASAYARAGLLEKARSHANRARAYAFGGAGKAQKTHRIFVLSPLNDLIAAKLGEMVADAEQEYARIEVYIQGFSEPEMHPGVCGADPAGWSGAKCTNLLPAQFNQYSSDDPLALVGLINAHKTAKKVKFVIMPTQLTKNAAFDDAVAAGLQAKLANAEEWTSVNFHAKRKFMSWHGISQNASDEQARKQLVSTRLKPLFDPFVAYMISRKYDDDAENETKLQRLAVSVGTSDLRLPVMKSEEGESNAELVYHSNKTDAAKDGAAYAEYVWAALTGTFRAHDRSYNAKFTNSVVQDWSDWDNLVSVRCILYSLPGDLALYSVGRPVAPTMPKCVYNFKAKYAGGDPSTPWPSWPLCSLEAIDIPASSKEAIDVAATWYNILRDWKKEDPNERSFSVSNCGFTGRHGMNPAMHSPIVDIYSVHQELYTASKGKYVRLLDDHEVMREKFRQLGIAVDVVGASTRSGAGAASS